ncbi:MAG: DedA family protein [Hydrogenophilales bacterium]|nr:DedA family protein [Hydrogenophilales bacterium]
MSLSGLIADYGYVALFAGALLEGETLLILAGFAAHQGYLQLHWVIGIALLGGFLGDQFYFWLGRRHGARVLSRFPRLAPIFECANALIERYHEALIVGIRFLYGLRTVGPLAFGMSAVQAWRFMLFNALGATIWAVGIGGAGYLFGHALELLLDDLKRIEEVLLSAILFGGIVFWGWRRWKFRRIFHQ